MNASRLQFCKICRFRGVAISLFYVEFGLTNELGFRATDNNEA